MNDITIDRSIEQKQIRLQELRAELDALGYHIVRKDCVVRVEVSMILPPFDKLEWLR